jgi:hypothetical protein
MKKLILSLDTYSWVRYCAGMISRNPEDFSIIVIYKDDYTPIVDCNPNLCSKAVYEQRVHDLFKIGKELHVKKIISLNYDAEDLEIEKLVMHLQLYITIGGITEVYFHPDDIVEEILKSIKGKLNIELFSFLPSSSEDKVVREVLLDMGEMNKKYKLRELMIGIPEAYRKNPVEYGSETFYGR